MSSSNAMLTRCVCYLRRLHKQRIAVPMSLWGWLLVACIQQGIVAIARDTPGVSEASLAPPPSPSLLRVLSLDDALPVVKLLNILLQAHDVQPGLSLSFRHLDYEQLVNWLERIVQMDPDGQYPLLAASRLYSNVPDDARRKLMTEFVARQFLLDPARHWQWMVHVVYVAKSQIKDIPLALSYASLLRQQAENHPQIPPWAAQLEIFIRANDGDLQGAKALIGALLDSGKITDEAEFRFLLHTLDSL